MLARPVDGLADGPRPVDERPRALVRRYTRPPVADALGDFPGVPSRPPAHVFEQILLLAAFVRDIPHERGRPIIALLEEDEVAALEPHLRPPFPGCSSALLPR